MVYTVFLRRFFESVLMSSGSTRISTTASNHSEAAKKNALVKRINANSHLVRSCCIDYIGVEEGLQLVLVPVPENSTGPFSIAIFLVESIKLRDYITLQNLMQKIAG